MKLLVVTQYFWPETFMINDLVRTLRDQGHDVAVATGKPNYPSGSIFAGYHAEGEQRETFDGNIPVFRVPMRPRGQGALGLARNYLSFAWSGARRFPRLLDGFRPDAILMYAPSPILGAIADSIGGRAPVVIGGVGALVAAGFTIVAMRSPVRGVRARGRCSG